MFHDDITYIISLLGVGSLPSSLTFLDISYNRLCTVNLEYLSHLYELRLHDNQLVELDNLPPNLAIAYVARNEITAVNFKILFQKGLTMYYEYAFLDRSIEGILTCWYSHSLSLDLSGYALYGINSLIGLCGHLEELDLSCNSLMSLPAEVCRHKQPTQLC